MSATQSVIESLSDGEILYDGEDIRFNCPLCGETKNKLYVSEKGVWHCFHCSESGFGAVSFIMQLYRISFKEAKEVAKEYGYVQESKPKAVISQSDSLAEKLMLIMYDDKEDENLVMPSLPTNTKLLSSNWSNPVAFPYFNYLHSRGVTKSDIENYNIGFCVNGTARTRRGALSIRNSIVFITKMNDEPVYWNTRSIDPNPFIKSFNAYAELGKEYARSQSLFNYDSIKRNNNVVICEGVFNAITISHIDGYCGLATFGKEVTDAQLKLIVKELGHRNLYLFLDNDANYKIVQLGKRFLEAGVNREQIWLVNNPYERQDANDLGESISKELLESSTNPSLSSFLGLGVTE